MKHEFNPEYIEVERQASEDPPSYFFNGIFTVTLEDDSKLTFTGSELQELCMWVMSQAGLDLGNN